MEFSLFILFSLPKCNSFNLYFNNNRESFKKNDFDLFFPFNIISIYFNNFIISFEYLVSFLFTIILSLSRSIMKSTVLKADKSKLLLYLVLIPLKPLLTELISNFKSFSDIVSICQK